MKKRSDFFLGFCMQPAPNTTDVYVRTPEDCYKTCEEQSGYGQEAFTVLCLNTRNRLIAGGIISIGIADATLVHPREVFRKAIEIGAAAIILAHNHPSGDPTPSAEDVRITRQLVQTGQVIGIKVLDHVVIGRSRPDSQRPFTSFREAGLVEFET